MLHIDETDFSTTDPRDYGPDDWALFKRQVLADARRARSELVKALALQLGHAIAAGVHRVTNAWRRCRTELAIRRQDREAIARLRSLDDCALKDIGIPRTEIESIVHAHDQDDTRQRRTDRLAA